MTGFLLGVLFVAFLVGGGFYGLAYLKAKAEHRSVVEVLISMLTGK
jgi:hypothetical protein